MLPSSESSNPLLTHSTVCFISIIVFWSSSWFFFLFSTFLLTFSLCSSILLMSSVSIFISVTLNCFSGKLIWIIFAFIPRFISETLSYSLLWNIFFCLLIYPNFLCLFLCVRWITYVSWSWRSSLMPKVSCGAWKSNAASLSLIICSLKVICKGVFCFVLFLAYILIHVLWASWICGLVPDLYLGTSQSLLFPIFLFFLSCFSLNIPIMCILPIL